jgi:hypothetical protein
MWIRTTWLYLALFAVPVAVILGLPTHIILKRTGRTSAIWYAATGGFAGVLVSGILFVTAVGDGSLIAILLLGILSGGLTGFFAWLIRRPDRDNNPSEEPEPRGS